MLTEEQRAISYLEQPETYPGLEAWNEHELLFRVWRYPAFGAYSTWVLREKDGEFRVRRLEWDRSKLSIGDPKIYGSESIVPTDRVASIIQRFRAITLPPFSEPSSWGIDGVIFGVESKSHYLNGRLSWWYRPPAG
ncbi:MAG TPA: hypothetical protein VJU84_21485 [Pyrinomonadaceae bacterium]|nr:hypothetical protein [Pyrinomonadaceae bacterium]